MKTVAVFRNGKSQAVRIPKELEFKSQKVDVVRLGNGLYVTPHEDAEWSHVRRVAEESSNYPASIPEAPEQERDLSW